MSYGPIGVYRLSLGICFSLVVYVFIIAPENINARQLLKINDNCQKITKLATRSCAICLVYVRYFVLQSLLKQLEIP